jgi:D-alanine--D-alanine ligase
MESIAIICGGPSLERGISLNSARSAMDHLVSLGLNIEIIYINPSLEFFHIDKSQLYCNTPSDFDFKLHEKLDNPVKFLSRVDIVFPLIHGKYGEDGTLQKFLEDNSIPFIGSSSGSCGKMFSKSNVNRVLSNNGFDTTELVRVTEDDKADIEKLLNIKSKVVVKPDKSGSSIAVSVADNLDKANSDISRIFQDKIDDVVVVEEYCEGEEFTVIVLESHLGFPTALIPTQVEILSQNKIFDYRKKYLPSNSTRWYCPPKFSDAIIELIMSHAEKIFKLFGARDFIRIDGWFLNDGSVVFTDINPISGMEQNSFIFQQAATCGMTHTCLLHYIISSASRRYNLKLPVLEEKSPLKNVFVLFGGDSAERQVSLMSGTNIWLKLLSSSSYRAKPFFLDDNFVWFLPYRYIMSHTVEEIKYNLSYNNKSFSCHKKYIDLIRSNLGLYKKYNDEYPYRISLDEFLDFVKSEDVFLFLGLHGGIGEDGTIQSMAEARGIRYNGSNSSVSRLSMNKYESGKIAVPGVVSLPKILSRVVENSLVEVVNNDTRIDTVVTYDLLKSRLALDKFIIKPSNDGCSAGVVSISCQYDLDKYVKSILNYELYESHSYFIEMPQNAQLKDYIIEPLIEVDFITVRDSYLEVNRKTGWVEMTVGIVEQDGIYHSFNPSVTVAENHVLSLEEKFQGGTGINLTPPPPEIISSHQLELIKKSVESIGVAFGLENYARIDIFFNTISDQLILIEVNTLPALTPSTVIFHQALAEPKAIYPLEFLERIISKRTIS